MADTRINALTGTATTVATDDYMALDGTTNGTRKILGSAFTDASNITSGVLAAARGGAGTVSGILKASGTGTVSAATSGTDYAPATTGTSILYGNGSGGFSNVTVGTGLSFTTGTLTATGGGGGVSSVTGTANQITVSPTTGNTVVSLVNSPVVSGTYTDGAGDLRSVPQNAKTSAYTLVVGDNGKYIDITTGGVTVPASVFSAGQVVVIYNNSSSNQTITQGSSVTMYQSGTTNTGNRTLAAYGVATVLCTASNTFVITGSGLS